MVPWRRWWPHAMQPCRWGGWERLGTSRTRLSSLPPTKRSSSRASVSRSMAARVVQSRSWHESPTRNELSDFSQLRSYAAAKLDDIRRALGIAERRTSGHVTSSSTSATTVHGLARPPRLPLQRLWVSFPEIFQLGIQLR